MSNLNNDGLFEQVLQAQETQREGWMAEIKVSMWEQRYNEMIATCAFTAKERDDALAEIDRLKKELGDSQEVAQDAIRCVSTCIHSIEPGHFKDGLSRDFATLTLRLKALTSQRQ